MGKLTAVWPRHVADPARTRTRSTPTAHHYRLNSLKQAQRTRIQAFLGKHGDRHIGDVIFSFTSLCNGLFLLVKTENIPQKGCSG